MSKITNHGDQKSDIIWSGSECLGILCMDYAMNGQVRTGSTDILNVCMSLWLSGYIFNKKSNTDIVYVFLYFCNEWPNADMSSMSMSGLLPFRCEQHEVFLFGSI